MKVVNGVIFGGSGRFGKEFISKTTDCAAPSHNDVDITDGRRVREYLNDIKPLWVLHAAAIVGRREAENDKELAYRVNVQGTENVAKAVRGAGSRMVYISSVAVFDGEKGRYRETDTPNPMYYYGWTKLLGEQSVRMLPNHVIVRTDFFVPGEFKYKTVFIDHYCSKLPVGTLVNFVNKIVNNNFRGTINLGVERESLFNILSPYVEGITGITIAESEMPDFPRDLSLDLALFNSILPESRVAATNIPEVGGLKRHK